MTAMTTTTTLEESQQWMDTLKASIINYGVVPTQMSTSHSNAIIQAWLPTADGGSIELEYYTGNTARSKYYAKGTWYDDLGAALIGTGALTTTTLHSGKPKPTLRTKAVPTPLTKTPRGTGNSHVVMDNLTVVDGHTWHTQKARRHTFLYIGSEQECKDWKEAYIQEMLA